MSKLKLKLKLYVLFCFLTAFTALNCMNISYSNTNSTENKLDETKSKIVRFATEATYPPFVTLEPSGEIKGVETEMVQAICKEANLTCEFSHKPFDSLFPNLALHKIDAVYGCIGISNERAKEVSFSKPLYTTPVGFLYASKENSFKENLVTKSYTIAIQQGTPIFEQYLKKYPNIKIKTYPSIQEALLDLNTGRVNAVFGDIPVFKYWLNNKNSNTNGNSNSSSSSDGNKAGSMYSIFEVPKADADLFLMGNAIAVRKEDKDLLNKINTAINSLEKSGKLGSMIEKAGLQ